MSINFPPGVAGATHTEAGVTWKYDGEKWVSQSTDEASLWTRNGSTLEPTNAGDDISAAAGTFAGGELTIDNGANKGYIIGTPGNGADNGWGRFFRINEGTTAEQSRLDLVAGSTTASNAYSLNIGKQKADNSGVDYNITMNADGQLNCLQAQARQQFIPGTNQGGTIVNAAIDRVNNGNGTLPVRIGTSVIQVTSDIRMKNKLRSAGINATEKLNQIEIFDFTWKEDDVRNNRGTWTGLSAQQLHEVLPFCVNTPTKEDGSVDYDAGLDQAVWCVDSTGLLPVLVKALQEQSSRIEALEETNASLEARLTALEGGNN